MLRITIRRAPAEAPPPPDVAISRRREMVFAAKRMIRRKSSFHGWLQVALLSKHALTTCNCGLINCR